jgi:ABC-type branched-subunit amino acid transport system substrate-binding protein
VYSSRQLDGSDCTARLDEISTENDVVVGPLLSACTVAFSRAAAKYNLPVLAASKATVLSNKTEFPTMYRLATSTKPYVEGLAFLLQLGSARCTTIIYDGDADVHT